MLLLVSCERRQCRKRQAFLHIIITIHFHFNILKLQVLKTISKILPLARFYYHLKISFGKQLCVNKTSFRFYWKYANIHVSDASYLKRYYKLVSEVLKCGFLGPIHMYRFPIHFTIYVPQLSKTRSTGYAQAPWASDALGRHDVIVYEKLRFCCQYTANASKKSFIFKKLH